MPFPFRSHAHSARKRTPTASTGTASGTGQSPGTSPSPAPPSSGVFGGGVGEWFEDFKADYQLGDGNGYSNTSKDPDNAKRMSHHWGDTSKTEHRANWTDSATGTGGSIFMNGTQAGVGLMGEADFNYDPNTKWKGYGNGLFEFRCKMYSSTGETGDNSGPAIVLWPGSNIWPGPEIDIGEIDRNGDIYFATHFDGKPFGWCLDRMNGDCFDAFYPKDAPWWNLPKTFYNDWHIYACFLQTDRMTYYLDGNVVAVDARNYGRDFANGGENHTLGIMNRSSQTTMECDWVRWTPEVTMLQKLSGASSGTGPPTTTAPATTTPPAATAASLDFAGPGGGSPGVFEIQVQGQSNANFWYTDSGATGGHGDWYTLGVFSSVLKALTNLTDAQLPVKGDQSNSVVGGTATYSLQSNDNCWLRGYDQDWGDPSAWPNNQLMTNFLNWAKNEAANVPAGRPIAMLRMHTEYESRNLTTDAERNVYEAMLREFIKRWRDAIGRGTALTPVFLAWVPYYANGDTTSAMRTAWRNICADPNMNCCMAVGSTMDVGSRDDTTNGGNGYLSHWDSDGSARVARRMAIRIGKWMHANGYSNRDLSGIPALGPRYVSFSRVSGAANKLDLKIAHDGGDDITVPGNTNLEPYTVNDNGTYRDVTAVARQDGSTVRLTLNGNLSASGPITVDYGKDLWFWDEVSVQHPGGTIYDNRHTKAWPASNAELGAARMNLQRLRTPLTEGQASGTAPGTTTTPPPTTTTRSMTLSPQNPGSRAAGVWNTVLTVAGIGRIGWVVQNGAAGGWSWTSDAMQVAVPSNGQVPIAANFTASDQFLLYFDASDSTFQGYSGPVTIVASTTQPAPTQPATVGAVQDPPAGWRQAFRDDFSQPAQWGIDALDYNIWKHRNYGYYDYEWGREVGVENHEATGSTYRNHVRKISGTNLWGVSGAQQGSQNGDPNGYGYHAGYHQLHVRPRQRWSHANAPGIGAYVLLWPASNRWTSEIDIMEMPGRTKNTSLATMHWNGDPGPDQSADAAMGIDLTQWHTFDLRRTYRQVNGVTAATVQLWIDGVAVQAPPGWIDNNRLTDPMVCGVNGFPSGAGWYGGATDGTTPDDAFLELDFLQLWTP